MTRSEKKRRYDGMLIVVVLLLVAAGLVLLYSTSAYNGQVKFHDSFYYLKKQGFATLLGLLVWCLSPALIIINGFRLRFRDI